MQRHAPGMTPEVIFLPELSLAIAVVGTAIPTWARGLPAEAENVGTMPEDGLNSLLSKTRAASILPVDPRDQLDPGAVARLARALLSAPSCYSCAAGVVDQVRRDGTVRRVTPGALRSPRDVVTALRLPTPILFRTGALRAAGGWRRGEACWEHRSHRHRGLMARLLEGSAMLPFREHLGTVARVEASECRADLTGTLQQLVFRHVTLDGAGLRASGRIVALTQDLVTLVNDDAPVTLVPVRHISAITRRLP